MYIKICKTSSPKHYQENKERLQKKAHKRYQNLSEEEPEKNCRYGRERYKNLSENEKQKLAKYRYRILSSNVFKRM